jgi:hypothetical protein
VQKHIFISMFTSPTTNNDLIYWFSPAFRLNINELLYISYANPKMTSILTLGMSLQALYLARLLVLADKASYDAIWEAVHNDPAECTAIASLGRLVQELLTRSKARPLQMNRLRSSAAAISVASTLGGSSGTLRKLRAAGRLPRVTVLRTASSVIPLDAFAALSRSHSDLLDCGVDGVLDPLRPVDSLDQLYCQSVALNPILIAKVQTWAERSDGCFCSMANYTDMESSDGVLMENQVSSTDNGCCDSGGAVNALPAGFVRWKDVSEQEQLVGGQVQWAKVKSVQRSIEKSMRSYGKVCIKNLPVYKSQPWILNNLFFVCGQDVSHLLDVCRQSIYFESIAGVTACLAAISRDSDVELSRIKNRFDPGLNSAASAGYRNLAVNLRIVTAETRALGIEMHVCEVQLLLLPMAAIKVSHIVVFFFLYSSGLLLEIRFRCGSDSVCLTE